MTLRAEELIESRKASAPHTVPKERAMRSAAVKFLTKLGMAKLYMRPIEWRWRVEGRSK
jgi:hypothetical protein